MGPFSPSKWAGDSLRVGVCMWNVEWEAWVKLSIPASEEKSKYYPPKTTHLSIPRQAYVEWVEPWRRRGDVEL